MKVLLGDLIHNWEKVGIWNMPLSIGYIASYAKAYAPKGNSYSLYKFPDRMIEAIRKEKPEVIALSYYVWNANLNDLIFNIAKEENPNVLTVGGGPMITNITVNEAGALDFFSQHTDCDIYVYNQGEIGFVENLTSKQIGRFLMPDVQSATLI